MRRDGYSIFSVLKSTLRKQVVWQLMWHGDMPDEVSRKRAFLKLRPRAAPNQSYRPVTCRCQPINCQDDASVPVMPFYLVSRKGGSITKHSSRGQN